jgi:hypothetical protein
MAPLTAKREKLWKAKSASKAKTGPNPVHLWALIDLAEASKELPLHFVSRVV